MDNKLTVEDLKAFKAAKILRKHTFVITTNRTVFPKRYFVLVNRVQEYALRIADLIFDANRDKNHRPIYGSQAIGYIDKLLSCIELIYEINSNFGAKRADYWKKLACDVKYLTIAWVYPKRK